MFFQKGLKATVMSTELLIEANVKKKTLLHLLRYTQEFEQKLSAYREDSLLNKINNNSGIEPVTCDAETIELLQHARKLAQQTNGVFDPTIGVLTQGLYGFGKHKNALPSEKQLKKIKELVDYRSLEITDHTVYLKQKGMRLDLGGIAKGFVADTIASELIENGATKGFVSVGGEICAFGKEFTFAIKNPFNTQVPTALIKTLKTPISITTSGDYERFIQSKKHHHILDTKTAKQNHYYTSLTLMKNGFDATTLDALTTLFFNTPPEQLDNLAKKFDLTVVAITHEKEILIKNYLALQLKSLDFFPFDSSNS